MFRPVKLKLREHFEKKNGNNNNKIRTKKVVLLLMPVKPGT